MKVYISGPMTGLPESNYPAFFAAEAQLSDAGFAVANPARIPDPDPNTWENYMRGAVKMVCDCDAVALLPGWEASRGARFEVELAKTLGLNVCELTELVQCK